MNKNVTIAGNIDINVTHNAFAKADLTRYYYDNIPDYETITEMPKKNMDFINNVKYAVNCRAMFYHCKKLVSIDLSKFNTKQVTDMGSMFMDCNSINEIDLSNFDTSKVTFISHMFDMCTNLHSLNISNWDTSSVTDMSYIFNNCISLVTIKGTLDLSSCTKVDGMFKNCSIKGLHLKNVPRTLLDSDGSLSLADGTLNKTYIIDNILEDK